MPEPGYNPRSVMSGLSFTSEQVAKGGRSLHLPKNTNQAPDLAVAGYSCVMSWEEVSGGGTGQPKVWNFDPDPVRIGWAANATINVLPTRGGQIAYSSGRVLGPLTITGYVRSSWDLLAMADFIYAHMEAAQLRGRPLRFQYPERNFDFGLYISNFNEIGLDGEVGEIKGYTITAQITQDFTALTQAKVSSLLPGLPENVEWIDVESAAKIAEERFGLAYKGGGGAAPPAEGEPPAPDEDKPPEEEAPEGAPQTWGTEPNLINDWLEGKTGKGPTSPTINQPPSTQPPQFGGP